jgi:hypothetical protein
MPSPVNRQRRFKRKASECLYIVQVTEETLAARMQVDPGTTGISDCLHGPGKSNFPGPCEQARAEVQTRSRHACPVPGQQVWPRGDAAPARGRRAGLRPA